MAEKETNVSNDMKIGNFYENLYTNITQWDTVIPAPNKAFLDWDMILVKNGKEASVEVKADLQARGTGNASIEIYGWDKYKIKPKGLMATKASTFVIFVAPDTPALKDKNIKKTYIKKRLDAVVSSSQMPVYTPEDYVKDLKEYGAKKAGAIMAEKESAKRNLENSIKNDLEKKLNSDKRKAEKLVNPYTYYVIPTKQLKRLVKSYYIDGKWTGGGWYGDPNGNERERDKQCPNFDLPGGAGGGGSAFNVLVPLYKLKKYKRSWEGVLDEKDGKMIVHNNLKDKDIINVIPDKLEVEPPVEVLNKTVIEVDGVSRPGLSREGVNAPEKIVIPEPPSLASDEVTPSENVEAEQERRREEKALRLLEYAGYSLEEEPIDEEPVEEEEPVAEAEEAVEQMEEQQQERMEEAEEHHEAHRHDKREIMPRREAIDKRKALTARRKLKSYGFASQYNKD